VRKVRRAGQPDLQEDHIVRVECAAQHLPANPLRDYGLERYVEEAKRTLLESGLIPESALTWLPDTMRCFQWLNS
jgi:hypothetical protein